MKQLILLLSIMLSAGCVWAQDTPESSVIINSTTKASTTQTEYGKVCGYIYKGIYTYKDINDEQAKRFEMLKELEPWSGIRSWRTYGPSAPQPTSNRWNNDAGAFFYLWYEGRQSEDCLCLNVWTKGINDGKKRPVLVWFHGGGFAEGCGQDHPGYHGHNLADKGDVVVVTVNHRLNTLGYTDRKSTRLNSSHQIISYAVFSLKKKKKNFATNRQPYRLIIRKQIKNRQQS